MTPELAEPLAGTLAAAAAACAPVRGRWWVIGSAAAALHGAGPDEVGLPVGDADLLFEEQADARAVLAALGVPAGPGAPHPRFRSAVFGRWAGAPLPVEVMAGFEHRDGYGGGSGGGWAPVRPVGRERAGDFWVPPRAELAAMLERFGRPGDLARAAALRAGNELWA